jgi:uncharacterized glyoxalase superfamily protein PhnB
MSQASTSTPKGATAMAETVHDTRPNIFPAFRYRDAHAALAWLTKTFGFEKFLEVPMPDGGIAHAEMSLGPGVIMLGSMREDPSNPWAAVRQGVYIYVADVDAHYARAKAGGADIVRHLQDTDYGSREYSVRDPEGFLWSFGTYRPGT